MRTHGLNHLSDTELLCDLRSLLARERGITAEVLAHLAEVDLRRLYVPTGYASMFAYCVGELGLSEDAAYKRIQAARASRKCPAILEAVAEGRLHLTGLGLLAPHLTTENAGELLREAAKKTKAEIEHLLACRFPRPDLPATIRAIPTLSAPASVAQAGAPAPTEPPSSNAQLAPAQVAENLATGGAVAALVGAQLPEGPGRCSTQLAPAQVGPDMPRPRPRPLSAESFAIQFTIGKATREKLQHVQELLSHQLPSGDIAQVFDQALDALTEKLEKRKFAATSTPRPRARCSAANPRHIPAHVKRAVWARDRGQCTFVSPTGHRCESRRFLEFDHVEPVARGGEATVAGIRLRCRVHNQYEADRAFGPEFMNGKREQALRRVVEARPCEPAADGAALAALAEARAAAEAHENDVRASLQALGFRSEEIHGALESCRTIPASTLEERVRAALKTLSPKARVYRPVGPSMQPCA